MAAAPPQRSPLTTAEGFLRLLHRDERLSGRIAHLREEPGRPPEIEPLPLDLPTPLLLALRSAGLHDLYSHQREAIERALAGKNVVIATETSSGKSLCFQLPVLSATLEDPAAHALFIFPTNPLANDQEESLNRLLAHLPPQVRPRPPVRLQGSMGAEKDRIAASAPQIVLTNPEMVHLHLLPAHRRWERFWRGLRYIVVDEIHLYRGAFGGHLANLLRRVRRCAWRYGAKPQIIAASATVGNPKVLAEELCSTPFELIDRSGAPRGDRTTVLWMPPVEEDGSQASYLDESVELFRRALDARLQTILFARSRQSVELLVSKLEQVTQKTRVSLGVRAYRGGYLKEEREAIEQGLRSGVVRGVVTTNALEVGIDIGSLDVCIIAGYPGSLMAVRQQAGRVGRRDRPSVIFLVASQNPLDTYYFRHPELLLNASSEQAVVGRLNSHILRAHLHCAANEFPLWEAEIDRLGGELAQRLVGELVDRGAMQWTVQDGRRVVIATNGRPHGKVSLRSASQERVTLIDPDGEVVGEIDGAAVKREAHPGAIYLHQGRTFRVDRQEDGLVHLQPARPGQSTRVQGDRSITMHRELRARTLAGEGVQVALAQIDIVDRYSSYLESNPRGKAKACPIEPPIESQLRTEGLVIRLSQRVLTTMHSFPSLSFDAALHGVEHLLGAFCSSIVLCDRDDMEGHTTWNAGEASIVLFDKYPGGMGFAATAYDFADQIVLRAAEAVNSCGCDDGCPACVHFGRCLRSSDEVSKIGARLLLHLMRGLPAPSRPEAAPARRPQRAPVEKPRPRTRTPSVEPSAAAPTLRVGDLVEHASFGRGRIIELRPTGRVVVDFEEGRSRRIAPAWLVKV
jgi:DEAD/DEAH box helicase domain-containing protein